MSLLRSASSLRASLSTLFQSMSLWAREPTFITSSSRNSNTGSSARLSPVPLSPGIAPSTCSTYGCCSITCIVAPLPATGLTQWPDRFCITGKIKQQTIQLLGFGVNADVRLPDDLLHYADCRQAPAGTDHQAFIPHPPVGSLGAQCHLHPLPVDGLRQHDGQFGDVVVALQRQHRSWRLNP